MKININMRNVLGIAVGMAVGVLFNSNIRKIYNKASETVKKYTKSSETDTENGSDTTNDSSIK